MIVLFVTQANLTATEVYGINNISSGTNRIYLIDTNGTLNSKSTISIDRWSSDATYIEHLDKIYLNNSDSVIKVYNRTTEVIEDLNVTMQMKTIVASKHALYGITYNINDANNSLYSINVNDGTVTEITTFKYDTGYGIPSATIIKSTDKLYTASSSGTLYEIDIFTGSVLEHNMTTDSNNTVVMQTLVADNNNTLYGIGNKSLYSINTDTGNVTLMNSYNTLLIPKASIIDITKKLYTATEDKELLIINLADGSLISESVMTSSMQTVIAVLPLNDPEADIDGDGLANSIDDDDDGDGMPDIYEEGYPGILDPYVDDANGDADNDTYSNIEEYLAGSNPNDNTDYPKVSNPAIIMYLLN